MSTCTGLQKAAVLPEARLQGMAECWGRTGMLAMDQLSQRKARNNGVKGPQSLAASACKVGQQKEGCGRKKVKDCGVWKDREKSVGS